MKKLKLALDVSKAPAPLAETVTQAKVWEDIIIAGAQSAYRDGGNIALLRKLDKLLKHIESAVDGVAELEDAEFEVLKDIAERGKFNPLYRSLAIQFADLVDEADDDEKEL